MPTRNLRLTSVLSALLAILTAALCQAQRVTVVADRPDGVYEVGQTITFRIEAKPDSTNPAPDSLTYILKQGGLTEVAHGTVALTNGSGAINAKLDHPGTLLAEVRWGTNRRNRALGGAVANPAKITPSVPRPADFDAFWQSKIKDLQSIPMNPQLESADSGNPNIDYFKITMNNIRESHIRGQLARPRTGDKFPALLIVQWAGVYPLQKSWVTSRAAEGWLCLNINAHDLPIDQPPAFYQSQNEDALRSYPSIGNTDRDTSYFLRMYLSCYRAADYLTQHPDWNGQTLVVTGGSQGGLQTLMLAGLHPKVTAALACVPAGCDMRGPEAGRSPGWPQWYYATQGKDPAKVRSASEYYDVVNFASHITCPVLVGLGLADETCPPAGIFAALNQMKGPKQVVILPSAGHQDVPNTPGSHAPYYAKFNPFLSALKSNQPPIRPTP